MIEKASFRNFKSLRHVDVDLERLTVFVGPNASGKTSMLKGIQWLTTTVIPGRREVLDARDTIPLLYTRGIYAEPMEVECDTARVALRCRAFPMVPSEGYPISRSPYQEADRRWQVEVEHKALADNDARWISHTSDLHAMMFSPEIGPLISFLRATAYLRLDPMKLAQPSQSSESRPVMASDGSGLATSLAFMALNQPQEFASIQKRLMTLIPTIERIRFDRVPVARSEAEPITVDGQTLPRLVQRHVIGDEIVLDYRGSSDIPAFQASEGSLLALGILTSLAGPIAPRLILIDDLDHGLHPRAQRTLIAIIRSILEENPSLQIIATTHSPFIVDELAPQEVRITWSGEDGITSCARMDEHPDLERWKDEMWPGEFWSLVGEQWVANRQPVEGR